MYFYSVQHAVQTAVCLVLISVCECMNSEKD